MIHKRARLAHVSVDPEQEKSVITAIVNLIQNGEFSGIVKMSCFFFPVNYNKLFYSTCCCCIIIEIHSHLTIFLRWRFRSAWILNFDLSNVSKINISSLSLTWGAFLFIDRFLSHRFTLYRLYQLRRRRSRFKDLTRLSLVRPRQVRKGGWCGISVTEECFKNTHENDPLTMI